MTATALLEQIFREKKVYDENGNSHVLGSNIDISEGEFLQAIISKHKPKNTIEIGCAQGISSLYICSALQSADNAHHTIIDAFQSTHFKNIGIANLKKAGITRYELIEGLSEIALPQLLAEGNTYDLAFIDGNHTFDHTLIDFFYLNRMIDVGGIIIFDDTGMPAVKKLIRYILNYPAYRQIGAIEFKLSGRKQLVEKIIKTPARFISKLLPAKIRTEVFAGDIIQSDQTLHLNATMVALQKIKRDERDWNWFENF